MDGAPGENMRRIRSKDTAPELAVRSLAHLLGYRFRLHLKRLPGTPDLAFVRRRKVIFVHGCFWHQHKSCIDGRLPKSRTDYWKAKLSKNKERDLANQIALRAIGWKSLVIWECQTKNPGSIRTCLIKFLGD